MYRSILSLLSLVFFVLPGFSQNREQNTEKTLKINGINPGIAYEIPVLKKSTVSANIGVGYGGSMKNTTEYASGFLYMIAPFFDIEYRKFYNLEKRIRKGRSIQHNSGNYWGTRFLLRGKEISSNFIRTDDVDFSFGPVWGIQRSYGPFHLLFDIGPVYYFDTLGNSGIFPFMMQLNLGYNIDI